MSKVQTYNYYVTTLNDDVRWRQSVDCWPRDTAMNDLPSSNR
jgi:hypothetical protein